ncbi:MAG: inorganic phosphate transporter [Candidatus Acidiferrales bacterium]
MLIFGVVLVAGLIFIGNRLMVDLSDVHVPSAWPYILLGIALLIALAFELVNGFHDTANAVALALGLGTMVGWKRIVVTVGEKIGKEHLTYAQGAAVELVAACTILAADRYGLPVSTTHVLSSGVAGTMAANRSGLQWSTIRNVALAWVFTLPAAALLASGLFWLFSRWA